MLEQGPILVAALVGGYLLGSIPFGLVLTRMAGLGDVRAIGSGNIGATNVLRTGSKPLAAATLALDMLKGTAAVLAGGLIDQNAAVLAGLGAVLGHLFPVWLKFRGGKGVATYLGTLLGASWPAALVFALVWLAMAALTRFSSLSALAATLATPFVLWAFGEHQFAQLFTVLSALVWMMHHANIRRLLAGEESRIGSGSNG